MKFRKKPVIIEAERFEPPIIGNLTMYLKRLGVINYQPPDFVIGGKGYGEQRLPQKPYYAIETLEGVMKVENGDWIITGVKGEKYPCKPDIFEQTYEKVSQ